MEAAFAPDQSITAMHLSVSGVVPGLSREEFVESAEGAEAACPVSQTSATVPVTVAAEPAPSGERALFTK